MTNNATKPEYNEYENLNETLITPIDNTITSVSTAVPTIEVVSPGTLPEGYKFDAQMGDRTLTVTVPKGGIEEGQKFSVPFPAGSTTVDESLLQHRMNVPVGQWKDEFLSCFKHGCCHSLLLNAFFCPLVANAQIMTRLQLNWNTKPGNSMETQRTFPLILYVVISFFTLDRVLIYMELSLPTSSGELTSGAIVTACIRNIIELAYLVYQVYTIMQTRKYLRNKYAIPAMYCSESTEDFCCALFCSSLTVAQMGRHTADYDTYHSACCTKTGLPDHINAVL